MEELEHQTADPSDASPGPRSPFRRRLAIAALVATAAVGGVGYGVAWAQTGDEPPVEDDGGTPTPSGCEQRNDLSDIT